MRWSLSWRADPRAAAIADRHYNRQKPGADQFVPPGRCVVLRIDEAPGCASDLILEAIAATRYFFPAPAQGLISFVNPKKVPGTKYGRKIYGRCYKQAGFEHVGFTQAGLWVWHLPPERMPAAEAPLGAQRVLAFG